MVRVHHRGLAVVHAVAVVHWVRHVTRRQLVMAHVRVLTAKRCLKGSAVRLRRQQGSCVFRGGARLGSTRLGRSLLSAGLIFFFRTALLLLQLQRLLGLLVFTFDLIVVVCDRVDVEGFGAFTGLSCAFAGRALLFDQGDALGSN